jgi:ABC-type polysaccharide/polyol phosphate export permease
VYMFVPAILCLNRMGWRNSHWLLGAVIFFGLALWFRVIDREFSWLPMGTHFLWHVCCSIGALFLGKFLVRLRKGIALKVYAG